MNSKKYIYSRSSKLIFRSRIYLIILCIANSIFWENAWFNYGLLFIILKALILELTNYDKKFVIELCSSYVILPPNEVWGIYFKFKKNKVELNKIKNIKIVSTYHTQKICFIYEQMGKELRTYVRSDLFESNDIFEDFLKRVNAFKDKL